MRQVSRELDDALTNRFNPLAGVDAIQAIAKLEQRGGEMSESQKAIAEGERAIAKAIDDLTETKRLAALHEVQNLTIEMSDVIDLEADACFPEYFDEVELCYALLLELQSAGHSYDRVKVNTEKLRLDLRYLTVISMFAKGETLMQPRE
jgi:hypothetical protein